MQKFELVIKNEKEKTYRFIGWIIIISNIVGMAYFSATTNFQKWGYLLFASLIAAYLVMLQIIKTKNKALELTPPFLFLIFSWAVSPVGWVSIINCVFLALDTIARRQLIVYVNADKIIYPSFPKKEIEWSDLSNMVIKDKLLTIDFKNNKLMQHEIVNDENDYDVNESEFNEFCKEQLKNSELYKYN
jgi:hypothetical protein